MSGSEGVSILVICRGRIKLLEDLFVSIDKADKDRPYEVIVVDNSDEKDAKTIEEMCGRFGFRYHYDPRSVAIKRNTAASLSKYDILLYLDSDCWIEKGTIVSHCRTYTDESIGAASGPVILEGGTGWVYGCIKDSPWIQSFTAPLRSDELPWGPTANFSMRRSVFDKIGGFDESFPNKPGGEDVDLGMRILSGGSKIVSAPEAVVHHSNKTWGNLHDMNRRLYNYGKADAKLCSKYPDNSRTRFPSEPAILSLSVAIILLSVFFDPLLLILLPVCFFGYLFLVPTFEIVIRMRRMPRFSDYVIYTLSGVQLLGSLVWNLQNRKISSVYRIFMYSPYQYRSLCENKLCCIAALMTVFIVLIFTVKARFT